jgi:hypothetical protein
VLIVQALLHEISDLLKRMQVAAEVRVKVNQQGRTVIGIILPEGWVAPKVFREPEPTPRELKKQGQQR